MSAINQFKIISNGSQLDTYDDLDISLTYQIDDIEDLTVKKSSFSKTIILPGTPFNNQYFKNIFDINIDIENTSYNPKKALPVSVQIGDEQIFTGNLQLLNIITNQKQVDYEVVITGVFKNIIVSFADYYLNQLNLDEFNHRRDVSTITNSYNNNIFINNVLTQTTPGTGYIYPLIVNGNSPVSNRIFNAFDLNPAIYVKTLMNKLFDFAGYTYSSNFLDSDYFNSLVVPTYTPEYSSAQINDRTVKVTFSDSFYTYYPFTDSNAIYAPWWYGQDGLSAISPFLQKSTSSWANTTNGSWWFPLTKQNGSIGNTTFQDPSNEWIVSANTNTLCRYKAQVAGFYEVDLKNQFVMGYIHKTGASFKYLSGNLSYIAKIYKVSANGTSSVLQTTSTAGLSITPPLAGSVGTYNLATYTIPPSGVIPSGFISTGQPYVMNLNIPSVWMNVGDEIRVQFVLTYPPSVTWQSVSDLVYVNALGSATTLGSVNLLSIKPATTTNYNINAPLNVSTMLPMMKMRDFFVNIVKMFNLIVYDDPNVANNLIIEPRDDFFRSKEKVKDWTYKLDYDQDIKTTPMSELDTKTYNFTYTEDEDYYNNLFQQSTDRIYGDFHVDFLNDFSTTDKELKLEFAPTPVTSNFIKPYIAPFLCDVDTNGGLRAQKVKARVLFTKKITYGTSPNNAYALRDTPTSAQVGSYTYVHAGMYDDPTDPEYSLEFGSSGILYYQTQLCCPGNNLINQFYLNTLNDITDVNSKLMEAYFWLTPSDINQFDFRDIIFIDNSYWRVNQIVDYNPNAIDRTTKVVLYKLNFLDLEWSFNASLVSSAIDCPTDIIAKKFKDIGYIYVSQSNQIITEDCCKTYGGTWTNGYCKAGQIIVNNPNGGLPNPNVLKSNLQPGTQIFDGAASVYNERPFELSKNQNIINSNTVIVKGLFNQIDSSVSNSMILGDNNAIREDIKNSLIIGDNITEAPSNSIVVGDIKITSDGIGYYYVYKIDGGFETVMDEGKTNLIDIIDGGFDSVRNFGGDSKLRPIISGANTEFE